MDDWDDFRFILALERSGTIRAAARALGINHSTVSRRLATINDRHGGAVFVQSAGGYRTTSLGAELAEAARQMENIRFAADRKQKAANREQSGPITLSLPGVIGQFLLAEALARFCSDHPAIELTVHSSYLFADLDRAEADVVIRGVMQPPDHLVGRRLFPYALAQYCSRDYLESTPLEQRRWIAGIPETRPPEWIAGSAFPDTPVAWYTDDIMLRHRAAIAGQGMIRGACYMSDPEPGLVRIPGTAPIAGLDIWVLTHPDLRETPRIKLLMGFIADMLVAQRDLIEGRSGGSQETLSL